MTAYYNEIDPFAAAWLRELIKADLIAPGEVDERSIEDVKPNDLMGFTQCHFFAGIGVWSYALRQSGFPDSSRVWTGSCPCQPFSAAGKGAGFNDERHLWPSFQWLIQQCCPPIIFGEQVASKSTGPWIDLVHADLEAMGYAFGCVPFPAASVGAPHIRDRAYWVAHSALVSQRPFNGKSRSSVRPKIEAGGHGISSGLADTSGKRLHGGRASQACNGRDTARIEPERFCDARRMADASSERLAQRISDVGIQREARRTPEGKASELCGRVGNTDSFGLQARSETATRMGYGNSPDATGWNDCDRLPCRDGKFRPVEPGTFPLANGAPARVGRLRGFGNAIVAPQAQVFIESVMETINAI